MTANDAATLLRTYGDALEETYLIPVDTSRGGVVAMRTETDDEVLEIPLLTDAPQRRTGRLTALSLGMAAAVALVIGFVLLNDSSELTTTLEAPPTDLVFEGETLLSVDPLIVAVNPPAEPDFDTSGLGDEFQLTTISDLNDPAVAAIARSVNESDTVVKITLLGQSDAGPASILVVDSVRAVSEDGQSEGEVLRTRYLLTPDGGSGSGDPIPDGDELFMLRAPDTISQFIEERGTVDFSRTVAASGEEPLASLAMVDVSLDVAVVQLVTDGNPAWTVPISGVAVLPTLLNADSVVEIFLYSSSGEQIYPR